MRKYLDQIGVFERPDTWLPDDSRQNQWRHERADYGFDERELWSMDLTFYCWLYERLYAYKNRASGDIVFHIITYKEKEYSQDKLIDLLIARLELALCSPDHEMSIKYAEEVNEIPYIWAALLPYMYLIF